MKIIDNVIKDCEFCGESFEDNTKPKNKKTCSSECARLIKNKKQREEYREHNPPKPNQRQLYYYDHYEYAFWNSEEKISNNQAWKTDVPYDAAKVEQISAAKQRYDLMGGRKKQTSAIEYNGDEKGITKINVHFVEHDDKEPSEVVTYKMTSGEFAEYMNSKK